MHQLTISPSVQNAIITDAVVTDEGGTASRGVSPVSCDMFSVTLF